MMGCNTIAVEMFRVDRLDGRSKRSSARHPAAVRPMHLWPMPSLVHHHRNYPTVRPLRKAAAAYSVES